MWSSRTHSLKVKGPAPTGLELKPEPRSVMAAGDPMAFMERPMMRGHWLFCCLSVTLRVWPEASIDPMAWARPRTGDAFAGACDRCQLNFLAAALNGVPSVNFTPSRTFSVHDVPSLDVNDSRMPGLTSPS